LLAFPAAEDGGSTLLFAAESIELDGVALAESTGETGAGLPLPQELIINPEKIKARREMFFIKIIC
jgi:hypothetical protein